MRFGGVTGGIGDDGGDEVVDDADAIKDIISR